MAVKVMVFPDLSVQVGDVGEDHRVKEIDKSGEQTRITIEGPNPDSVRIVVVNEVIQIGDISRPGSIGTVII